MGKCRTGKLVGTLRNGASYVIQCGPMSLSIHCTYARYGGLSERGDDILSGMGRHKAWMSVDLPSFAIKHCISQDLASMYKVLLCSCFSAGITTVSGLFPGRRRDIPNFGDLAASINWGRQSVEPQLLELNSPLIRICRVPQVSLLRPGSSIAPIPRYNLPMSRTAELLEEARQLPPAISTGSSKTFSAKKTAARKRNALRWQKEVASRSRATRNGSAPGGRALADTSGTFRMKSRQGHRQHTRRAREAQRRKPVHEGDLESPALSATARIVATIAEDSIQGAELAQDGF